MFEGSIMIVVMVLVAIVLFFYFIHHFGFPPGIFCLGILTSLVLSNCLLDSPTEGDVVKRPRKEGRRTGLNPFP